MTESRKRNRRPYGDGSYRRRGDAWELKFRANDAKTGARVFRYVSFKGSETAARSKLRDLVKAVGDGGGIAPARQTFADVLDAWDRTLSVSPKTAERYRELVRLYVRPHLGALRLQALLPSRIGIFYADLREGNAPGGLQTARPLSARTINHIHRLVVKVLSIAERDRHIASNPARHAVRPKVERTEIEILTEDQGREVLAKLRGRAIYPIVLLGLATGMRRGEMLALRWKDLSFDAGKLQVQQSLEQTKGGLRFKVPKTKHGRRQISLPGSVISELRARRRAQAEQRLALGLGKDADDSLVFRHPDGSPLLPNSVTTEWRRLVRTLKLPRVSLHALRHTHASQSIASGEDVLTISRRLGHSSPSITLNVYGHLFNSNDDRASAVFEKAFGKVVTDGERSGTKAACD